MQRLSRDYITSNNSDYVNNLDRLQTPINSLDQWIVAHETSLKAEAFSNFLKPQISSSLKEFIKSDSYQFDRRRVGDSILAHSIARDENLSTPAILPRALRLFGIIERLSRNEQSLMIPGEFKRALKALIILPLQLFPLAPF